MVDMQKEQATEARQKETDRQARIDQGLAAITAAFEGSPVMATKTGSYDWSGFGDAAKTAGGQVSGLPAGYTYVNTAGGGTAVVPTSSVSASTGAGGGRGAGSGGSGGSTSGATSYSSSPSRQGGIVTDTRNTSGGTVNTAKWAVKGPDGKIYQPGEVIPTSESYATGETTGGFDDSFYDKFKQSILDYYMPQVEDQYGKAKDQTTYGLARAGTLQSSAATDEAARLAKENELNRANVVSQADTGAAGLRSRVAQERAKAESTLYATEDPDVATNQALAAVKDVSVAQPELTPLGQVFQTALIGGANAYTGARNQNLINQYKKRTGSGTTVV